MNRTTMHSRREDTFQIAYENLKHSNQILANKVKELQKEIKELEKENTSLAYRLRVVTNKYNKILNEALKVKEECYNEQD